MHTNNSTHVPPSKTHKYSNVPLTKKKEPKKEFSLHANDNSAFPSLSQTSNASNVRVTLSFANATKNKINSVNEVIATDSKPGWVHIRKNNGKIEYKYGKSTRRYPCSDDNFENRLNHTIFNIRLLKEQYERDNDIIRLGDLSEYYGEKTLHEMFEEEERLIYVNESDNDSSSLSETEYEQYFVTYENNKFEFTV
jgi:hypothetical protein